jgi:penicillin-binding protein 1C
MRVRRAILALVAFLAAIGFGLWAWLFAGLPPVSAIGDHLNVPSVRITDRHGRLLYEALEESGGRHTVVALDQIPLALRQATIATEDQSFYRHPGVDLAGIARALWINLRGGETLAGGSTITQQVARNLLLEETERGERTVRRKLRESWLAWRLSLRYTKDEILALYLNQMYYGGLAYGVEAASQTYFAKSVTELTLAESALLAGLPQAPAIYNPLLDPDTAKERQMVVLGLMLRQGFIDDAAFTRASRQPLVYATTPYPIEAPHFVFMVEAALAGLGMGNSLHEIGGATVRTTLDLDWQRHAEAAVASGLERLNNPPGGGPAHNAQNAALVALDPVSGEVLALVGNDGFLSSPGAAINMAVAPRQPGSAFKPFIYAAALDPRRATPWTAATMILDVQTSFLTDDREAYIPVNFDRQEHGPVLLRQALAASLNIPAVAALDEVGVDTAVGLARGLGITTLGDPDEYDLSLALGGGAVSPLELTAAYGSLANGGNRVTPVLILDVTDAGGATLYQATPPALTRVLDERVAWLVSVILADDDARRLSFGPNSILRLDRVAAVKTGTTNDFRDNWTIGYTPEIVTGVWVGNANNEPMVNVSGISGAGPIWSHFMRTVLAGRPDRPFARPAGLVEIEVCANSGLLPTPDCPYRRREWFIAGVTPQQYDTVYRRVIIDRATGRLADEGTPSERLVAVLALSLPPEAIAWARSEGLPLVEDYLPAGELVGEHDVAATPLTIVAPIGGSIFRLSPTLPGEAQRLRLEAIATAGLREVTIWLDGRPLPTTAGPPYVAWWPLSSGDHELWAEARQGDGQLVRSETVPFRVAEAPPG